MTTTCGLLPPDGWPVPHPSGGSPHPEPTPEQRAHAHPTLRRLHGWTWEDWAIPGPAADRTLVGYRAAAGVLVSLFVQTEDAATARWTTTDPTPREVGVVHGSVADVLARITEGRV